MGIACKQIPANCQATVVVENRLLVTKRCSDLPLSVFLRGLYSIGTPGVVVTVRLVKTYVNNSTALGHPSTCANNAAYTTAFVAKTSNNPSKCAYGT